MNRQPRTESGRQFLALHRHKPECIAEICAIEDEAIPTEEQITQALGDIIPRGLCPSCSMWFGEDQDPPHMDEVIQGIAHALYVALFDPATITPSQEK